MQPLVFTGVVNSIVVAVLVPKVPEVFGVSVLSIVDDIVVKVSDVVTIGTVDVVVELVSILTQFIA